MDGMPKYIEVNALKRKIRSGKAGYNLTKKELATVFYDINNTPSADVVEVVRCKNCKHCEKAEEKYEGDRFEPTDIVCTVNNVYTYSNGFCSYGERKDG